MSSWEQQSSKHICNSSSPLQLLKWCTRAPLKIWVKGSLENIWLQRYNVESTKRTTWVWAGFALCIGVDTSWSLNSLETLNKKGHKGDSSGYNRFGKCYHFWHDGFSSITCVTKWDRSTQNICLGKKSLTSIFYTSCVSSVVNCATVSVLSLLVFLCWTPHEWMCSKGAERECLESAFVCHLELCQCNLRRLWWWGVFPGVQEKGRKKALCSEQRNLHEAHSMVKTSQMEKQVMQGG